MPVKLRWTLVVVSSVALILASVFIWHFVRSELNNRQLAKDAAAFRIRAERGDPEAQFKLGSFYSKGRGVPTDFVAAVRWYRKSAEQGYTKAEYNLSTMYREGKGVPQDNAEAERWCRKAADNGEAKAQDGLGILYYRGEGVRQDYAEAARWYRRSAEQGYADAQYNLGYMYQEGKGVSKDHAEAVRWLRKAAEQGYARAQDGLGLMYYRGEWVAVDYVEAARWYRRAAEQGDEDAQYNLGYMLLLRPWGASRSCRGRPPVSPSRRSRQRAGQTGRWLEPNESAHYKQGRSCPEISGQPRFWSLFSEVQEPPKSSADSHGCSDVTAYLVSRLGCVLVLLRRPSPVVNGCHPVTLREAPGGGDDHCPAGIHPSF